MLRSPKKTAAFAGPRRAKGRRIFRGWVKVRFEFCDLHSRVVRSLPPCRPRAGEGVATSETSRVDPYPRPLPARGPQGGGGKKETRERTARVTPPPCAARVRPGTA